MAKRRFELVDPSRNHNKFWEVEVKGSKVTTWWGRIGQAAASKTKDFGSPARAEAEASKLVMEKTSKGYLAVSGGKAVSKKGAAKKVSPKKGGKLKCAHCGMRSKGPTDCPEPWEHGNFKCSCAWCKANAFLKTDEVNWLAQHGWSSAQIKALNESPKGRKEARALIKAGKNKKPGPVTRAALGLPEPTKAKIKAYRDDLLKAGVAIVIPRDLDAKDIAKMVSHVSDGPRDLTSAVKFAMTYGGFTDGKRCLLIVPANLARDVKRVLEMTKL